MDNLYGESMDTLVDLVAGIPTPLKNIKVNWYDEIPNIWKNKKSSKPPTREHGNPTRNERIQHDLTFNIL